MLIHQELRLKPGGIVTLRNVTEDNPTAKAMQERRRQHYEADNPKGWTQGRTMQHLAGIPEDIYHFDPLCREYQRLRAAGNPEEARRTLRLFLSMNPQYRASEARL
jgi:hypothetical protein